MRIKINLDSQKIRGLNCNRSNLISSAKITEAKCILTAPAYKVSRSEFFPLIISNKKEMISNRLMRPRAFRNVLVTQKPLSLPFRHFPVPRGQNRPLGRFNSTQGKISESQERGQKLMQRPKKRFPPHLADIVSDNSSSLAPSPSFLQVQAS